MDVREITACRSCGSGKLETVLDLGNLCVSDFIKPGDAEDRAPLELVVCLDCSLVQLRHTVERDRLYRGSYWYRSGTNESMRAALRDVVEDACSRVPGAKCVLDIGCNDGTMLRMFPQEWTRCGFEPSNLAEEAQEGNDTIWRNYFTGWPTIQRWDIITSIAMFYDLDDPNAFVKAIKDWLHPDGVWVVQFQDLRAMLTCNGFDNICHEHLLYLSEIAFTELVARHGLRVDDVSYNNTNGGSVRYIVRHGEQESSLRTWAQGFSDAWELISFSKQVEQLKRDTLNLLWRLKGEGKLVLGYGASTKGNTLLQYYGIDASLLPAIAERAPEKVGRQTVGSHIPIISEEEMRRLRPDYLFVLPWHFVGAFRKREADFLARGGQFILPLPTLITLGGEPCQPTHAASCASV
jgi:NDP-4-keto-2,6-dideoxyhexose 3-C-methyltransferase